MIALAVVAGVLIPWLIPLSVMVIGTRQLGLAILMHDAAHGLLHPNRRINDVVGLWLCSSTLRDYRPYHLQHHRYVQQAEDPDLVLSAPFWAYAVVGLAVGAIAWFAVGETRDLARNAARGTKLPSFFGQLRLVGANRGFALVCLVALANAGSLVAFTAVNLAVVRTHLVDQACHRNLSGLLRYGVVPLVGMSLTLWLWTSLSALTLTIGMTWFTLGLVYLGVLTGGFRKRVKLVHFSEAG